MLVYFPQIHLSILIINWNSIIAFFIWCKMYIQCMNLVHICWIWTNVSSDLLSRHGTPPSPFPARSSPASHKSNLVWFSSTIECFGYPSILCKWNHNYIFFCARLLSFSTILWFAMLYVAIVHPFFCREVTHRVDVPRSAHPASLWHTPGLFQCAAIICKMAVDMFTQVFLWA